MTEQMSTMRRNMLKSIPLMAAIVGSASKAEASPDLAAWLAAASPDELAQFYAKGLAEVLERRNPGHKAKITIDGEGQMALVHIVRPAA